MGLLGAKKMPAIPAPVVMPTENAGAVTDAQQKAMAAAAARSGRASTMLANQDISKSDTMGG